MGKLTSILEKYNLIEKESEASNETTMPEELDEMVKTNKPSLQTAPSLSTDQDPSPATSETTTSESSSVHAIAESKPLEATPQISSEPEINFDQRFSLSEIYTLCQLDTEPSTKTVFVLENLLNALPTELTDYVKKATLNNILVASAMNTSALLEDGQLRVSELNHFLENYTHHTTDDITSLKNEINKLSQIIESYHQQIKQREVMLQEQTTLIKTEEERIQNILTFFKD